LPEIDIDIRRIDLPRRGGEVAAYDMGPKDWPVDIVFSHANGFNARTYLSILAPLAERARILAFDLRGHGRSTLATGHLRTDWSDIAGDLVALLETQDLTGVVLAGHSMGATTSLMAAAEVPGRVRSLALFEPVIMPPRQPGEAETSPLVQGALKRRRAFADRAEAEASYAGRGAFRDWTPAMLADYVADGFRDAKDGGVELACSPDWEFSNYVNQGHDARAALAASTCTVRILRAENRSTCTIDAAEAQALAPGRSRVETVEGTTHFLPMERPGLVAAVLRETLRGA